MSVIHMVISSGSVRSEMSKYGNFDINQGFGVEEVQLNKLFWFELRCCPTLVHVPNRYFVANRYCTTLGDCRRILGWIFPLEGI
jgi:hypothetical protein